MPDQRLRLLDGFLKPANPAVSQYFGSGSLTIVDLTDPFLDGACRLLLTFARLMHQGLMASLLFDIVLGSFMSWKSASGKIVGEYDRHIRPSSWLTWYTHHVSS